MYAAATACRFSILTIIVPILMLSACAIVAPREAENSSAAGKIDVSLLTTAMAHRDRALESLQTSAVMEYTNGTDRVKAREDIVVRRPGSLRVEAMSPF